MCLPRNWAMVRLNSPDYSGGTSQSLRRWAWCVVRTRPSLAFQRGGPVQIAVPFSLSKYCRSLTGCQESSEPQAWPVECCRAESPVGDVKHAGEPFVPSGVGGRTVLAPVAFDRGHGWNSSRQRGRMEKRSARASQVLNAQEHRSEEHRNIPYFCAAAPISNASV